MTTHKLEGQDFILELEVEQKTPYNTGEGDTSESVGSNNGFWFGQGRISHLTGGDRQVFFLVWVKHDYNSAYWKNPPLKSDDKEAEQLLHSLFQIKGWANEHQVLRQGKLNDVFIEALLEELDVEMSSKPTIFPLRWVRKALYCEDIRLHNRGVIRIPGMGLPPDGN